MNIPLEIGRGNLRIFSSGIDPVGTLLGEHGFVDWLGSRGLVPGAGDVGSDVTRPVIQ